MTEIGKVTVNQACIQDAIDTLRKVFKMMSRMDEANSIANNEEQVVYSELTKEVDIACSALESELDDVVYDETDPEPSGGIPSNAEGI